ncbi:hypothetical protein AVEN_238760-1 [Araneus ventricosus]|uniref:Uncharacterized protein n=1 Tax=Araneus ventricosus TaxID=182803 RepID=A0A4Y2LH13_ARAVE|nr:hypothetical protein AVEN_238760-1 [Araneus ventricosus]
MFTVHYSIDRYRELQNFYHRDRSEDLLHEKNITCKVQDHPRKSAPQVPADLKTDYNSEVVPQTQDSYPQHTSKVCEEWCRYRVKQQLHNPPRSPDFNLIEQHLWKKSAVDSLNKQI